MRIDWWLVLIGFVYFTIGIQIGKYAVRRMAIDEEDAAFIGTFVMLLWPVGVTMFVVCKSLVVLGRHLFPLRTGHE